jgi:secreted trypsin-like serine protease
MIQQASDAFVGPFHGDSGAPIFHVSDGGVIVAGVTVAGAVTKPKKDEYGMDVHEVNPTCPGIFTKIGDPDVLAFIRQQMGEGMF